jgi:hypothetical protein
MQCTLCGPHFYGTCPHGTVTATTVDMKPVSLETLTRAMQEIDLLPKPDQWIVVDPQGRMYKGTVEQVLPVLTAAHPLFKMPLAFGPIGRIDG